MGAVRPKKNADPTETLEPPCQPASRHRWEERQRVVEGAVKDADHMKRGNVRYKVTWRCRSCKKVIIVTTKPVNWAVLSKPWKYPRPRKVKNVKKKSSN